MATGRLSGRITIRPVRMGILVEPNLTSIRSAVEKATSSWGGMYCALIDQSRPSSVLKMADRLGIDALHALSDDQEAQDLAATMGYQWYGFGQWGPYEQPKEYLSARLMGPDWLLERAHGKAGLVLPRWSDNDPLADLFTVWFGSYGSSEYEQRLEGSFLDRALTADIEPDGNVDLPTGLPPAALTSCDISYSGDKGPSGFVVLAPDDPIGLMVLWNLRATGGAVFPWPQGHAPRVRELARTWIDAQLEAGTFSGWRRADGQPLPPQASVILPPGGSIPDDLADLLQTAGVQAFPDAEFTPRGWTGMHPLHTDFERSFSVELDDNDWSASIALPEFPPRASRDQVTGSMTVAAQIEVYEAHGLGTTRWVTIPNVRSLCGLLGHTQIRSSVRRPTRSGRVFGIPASSEEVSIEVLPAMQVIAKLFEGSPWKCSQSENGRFAGRLSELLGGPGATSASEPALREVLASTARSPVGKSVRELNDAAKRHRGSWPPGLSPFANPDDYAENVVLRLLYRKLLRPHLVVRCPVCSVAMSMRPEDLATSMACEMCSAAFPLGYALGLARGRQATWRFRLPPDIGEERILEATALIATAAAVNPIELLQGGRPHQFGIELSAPRQHGGGEDRYCELDIFMVLDDRGQSEVVVGEVKNRGYLEEDDLSHLLRVQRWFLDAGIHCYPLFATLRESLRDGEIELLRRACENAPRSIGSHIFPLAPIVLLGPDLSVAPMEPGHPRSWRSPGGAWGNFAIESYSRNVGLVQLDFTGDAANLWSCQWS